MFIDQFLEIISNPKSINNIGLAFDIFGAVLLFKYGVAKYDSSDLSGIQKLVIRQIDEDVKRKANKAKKLSGLGIIMLITGFSLQLISNFLI
jgi:hypothetical protein